MVVVHHAIHLLVVYQLVEIAASLSHHRPRRRHQHHHHAILIRIVVVTAVLIVATHLNHFATRFVTSKVAATMVAKAAKREDFITQADTMVEKKVAKRVITEVVLKYARLYVRNALQQLTHYKLG